MFAKDKHSSLLRKSVNYGQKSFITLDPVVMLNMVILSVMLSVDILTAISLSVVLLVVVAPDK